jgi:hypothetical protein
MIIKPPAQSYHTSQRAATDVPGAMVERNQWPSGEETNSSANSPFTNLTRSYPGTELEAPAACRLLCYCHRCFV